MSRLAADWWIFFAVLAAVACICWHEYDAIAGSYVTSGQILRSAQVRVLRNGEKLFEGRMDALKRFKDDVREVREGNECGMSFEAWQDIQEGDTLEFFEEQEVTRTL